MIGEFGGIGAFVDGKQWVPNRCAAPLHVDTPTEEAYTYINMVFSFFIHFVLHLLSCQFYLDSYYYLQTNNINTADISVSIYTQITDVELECDGFFNYDRTSILAFPFSFPSLSYSFFPTLSPLPPLSLLPSPLPSPFCFSLTAPIQIHQ